MKTTFQKSYTNHIGRQFHRFTVTEGERMRTFDIVVRKGRKDLQLMTKAQAKERAAFLFSMGDEIESMKDQLIQRYRQYGEAELHRCYIIALDAGLYGRWEAWLVKANDPLANEPGSKEWRFSEFIRREAACSQFNA